MEKYIKDGQVAVLFSPGFGAGWYTWNTDYPQMVFDPKIVEFLIEDADNLTDKIVKYCENTYPDSYLGGAEDLVVCWIPIGTEFRINEYDGSESIEIKEKTVWLTA